MRVRMLTTAAGPGGVFIAGQVRDVDAEYGDELVAGGFAAVMEAEPRPEAPETATAEPPENAMMPAPERRKAGRRPERRGR